jgi:hypothetical protein
MEQYASRYLQQIPCLQQTIALMATVLQHFTSFTTAARVLNYLGMSH